MRLVAILCAGLALAIAGCGGDDEDASERAAGGNATTAAESTTDGGGSGNADESGSGGSSGSDTTAGGREGGDEESSSDGGEESLSHAEYVRAADRICFDSRVALAKQGKDLQKAVTRLAQKKINRREFRQISADLTAEFARLADRALDRIEALPKPDVRRDALDDYLEATRTQIRLLSEQAETQRRADAAGTAKRNVQLAKAGDQTQSAARRFGFRDCGGGGPVVR